MYNGTKINTLGSIYLKCSRNGKQHYILFLIVKEKVSAILGCKDCEKYGIIKILHNDVMKIEEHFSATNKSNILEEFEDVFTGRGKLGKKYSITIDPESTPIVNAPRRVPFALMKELKTKLDELVNEGYLKQVTEPTDWVSSLVVVRKPTGKLRICIDPTNLNKAIKRQHYPTPQIEDVLPELKNAKVFSLLDAKDGFWQVELDDKSSRLTCFNTPFGRFRWTVMPFGISSAPEVFQQRMIQAMEGLQGIAVIADDILVYGKGDTIEEA